ncbi:lysozyme [Photobacterium leiognathi subsp. mandapamensis]|uniref:lysozyme n=1 Tax=Photobacterium leiognathi TaxID=553611 RepID=UPI003AF378D8
MNKIKKVLCSVVAVIGVITGGVAVDQYVSVGNVVIDGQHLGVVKTSSAGLALIGNAEGCRLDPYKCPAGLTTNGMGNTHDVPNKVIDEKQAAIDWVKNIQDAEQCLDSVVPKGKALTQGQQDAFTSFIFNTGCTRFKTNRNGSQTQIARLIEHGEFSLACDQLNRWVYGGGKKLNGLVIRRGDETERCHALD